MEQGQYEWQSRPDGSPILGSLFQNYNPQGPNEINNRPPEHTEEDIRVGVTVELLTTQGERFDVRVDEIAGEHYTGTIMQWGPRTSFRKEHVFSFLDEPKKKTR